MSNDDKTSTLINARVAPSFRERIDAYRRRQAEIPPRSKALCDLADLGLQAEERRLLKEHPA